MCVCVRFFFWHPMLVRPVMKSFFFPWKTEEKKARFARAPPCSISSLFYFEVTNTRSINKPY